MVKQQPHHNVGTYLWHVSPQTAMPPHTIREISHPQKKSVSEICVSQRKAKRDPCEKCYFSSRSATA